MADAAFNTLAPSFQLLLDGAAAPIELAVNVIGIRVTEDLTRPSRFTLNVGDVGRVWTKSNKFKSGREVEVKLGYTSKVESVIKAEVHSWEVDLAVDGPARLVVQGYDRLHRFTRGPKTRTFLNQTDGDIVRKIAQEHGLSLEADPTPVIHPFVLQNNIADFDFLLERAALCGFEVQVQGKKLLFKKPAVSRSPVVKLTWGENIGRIAHEVNTFDQAPKIEARAWDPVNQKLLTAPAKQGDELSKMGGQTLGAKLTKERFGEVQEYVLSAATSLKEIEDAVKAEYNRRAGDFVLVECRVDGDPRIRAGSIVEIEKAGKRLDGVYYVTWAEHIFFTDSGYATEFRARRYSMDKGSGAPKDVTPAGGLINAIEGAAKVVNAITNGVEKARACFQAAKTAVEKARKTLQDAQRALNNTIAAVKTAVEAVEKAMENAKEIADAAFREARAFLDGAQQALDSAKSFLLKAADTLGAPPEFKQALESAFKAADSAVQTAQKGLSMAEDFISKGGGLLDKAQQVWDEIKQKLGGGSAEAPIPVGSKIAPPKIAVIASSESDEKKWFGRLEKVAIEKLQPGDILLSKSYEGGGARVKQAQQSFVADKGSAHTVQALLHVGNGEVLRLGEAGIERTGLKGLSGVSALIVYRPSNSAQAVSAVEVAGWLEAAAPVYSTEKVFSPGARNLSWGTPAQERAKKIAAREAVETEYMCSGLVAMSYQGIAGSPGLRLDALRVSPMELEDFLNDGTDFVFSGALGPSEISGKTPDIETLKEESKALQEAGASAKEALETAQKAVALAGSAVEKASANDPAAADAVTAQADATGKEASRQADEASSAAADATAAADAGEGSSVGEADASAASESEETGQGADELSEESGESGSSGDASQEEAPASPGAEVAPEAEPAVDSEQAAAGAAEEGAAPAGASAQVEKAPEATSVGGAELPEVPGESAAPETPTLDAPEIKAAAVEDGQPQVPGVPKTPQELSAAAAAAESGAQLQAGSASEAEGLSPESVAVGGGVAAAVGIAGAGVAAVRAAGSLTDSAESLASKARKAGAGTKDGVAEADSLSSRSKKAAKGAEKASEKLSLEETKKSVASAQQKASSEGVREMSKGVQPGLGEEELELPDLPVAEASKVRRSAEAVASGDKESLNIGLDDVVAARNAPSELRGVVREAQTEAANLRWKAENADELLKNQAKGAVLGEVREVQSVASEARYMVENADTIAKNEAASAVNEALGLRELQADAASAKYVAENAGSIAKNEAVSTVNDALGLRELQADASNAKYVAENAGTIAQNEVRGTAMSGVRGAQLEAQDAAFEAKMVANTPANLAGEARSLKLDATMRAERIASGDVTEAVRTAKDAERLNEALAEADLELELPDLPESDDELV